MKVQPDSEGVIAIQGVFDSVAAARLRAWCIHAATRRVSEKLVVDFSGATEISDIALAILIEQQAAGVPRLIFRSLSKRHNRMLRYLGSTRQTVGGLK